MRKKGSNTFLPVKPSPSAVVSKPFILCTLWAISYSGLKVLHFSLWKVLIAYLF